MRLLYYLPLLFIFSACTGKKTEPVQAQEAVENTITLTGAQAENAVIGTDTVTYKKLSAVLKLHGKIDVPPQNMVSVSMPLGGYLKSTKLLPGMHVNRGETIAIMEDGQYVQMQQDYLEAKSRLVYAEAEYKRQLELNSDKSTSDKVFQQANMEYELQKITVNALAQKLQLININPAALTAGSISKSVSVRSPIDGFVTQVNVNIGKYVNPADILFELVNPTDIHLNLVVFEKDIASLFIGQQIEAYTNENPQEHFPCEIILISKDVSAEGSAEVHCHFEKYDKRLLPGMYMNAEVKLVNNLVPALPEAAIVDYQGKNYVFAEDSKNKYTMLAVETGTREDGFIELKNTALVKGKKLVIKNAYTLLMALKNKAEEE